MKVNKDSISTMLVRDRGEKQTILQITALIQIILQLNILMG